MDAGSIGAIVLGCVLVVILFVVLGSWISPETKQSILKKAKDIITTKGTSGTIFDYWGIIFPVFLVALCLSYFIASIVYWQKYALYMSTETNIQTLLSIRREILSSKIRSIAENNLSDYDSEEDKQLALSMIKQIKYKYKYTFPKKIKSLSIQDAMFTSNGKSFVVEYSLYDVLNNPEILNFEVVLED